MGSVRDEEENRFIRSSPRIAEDRSTPRAGFERGASSPRFRWACRGRPSRAGVD
jgi:hypothetical protein